MVHCINTIISIEVSVIKELRTNLVFLRLNLLYRIGSRLTLQTDPTKPQEFNDLPKRKKLFHFTRKKIHGIQFPVLGWTFLQFSHETWRNFSNSKCILNCNSQKKESESKIVVPCDLPFRWEKKTKLVFIEFSNMYRFYTNYFFAFFHNRIWIIRPFFNIKILENFNNNLTHFKMKKNVNYV